MNVWDSYQARVNAGGESKFSSSYEREKRMLLSKLPDNLSYDSVEIYPSEFGFNIDSWESQANKITQNVSIKSTDNLNEKIIYTLPDEDIELGSLVDIDGFFWLVCEKDYKSVLYTKVKVVQCNHVLKWIHDGEIISQWCIVEDGTKYMTGELEDKYLVVTRGDSRIQLSIARNIHTVKLDRESRFLIDDEDSPHKLCYQLTKPLKMGMLYGGKGIFKFVLQETTSTGDDNHEIGIADYYKYFHYDNIDVPNSEGADAPGSIDESTGKKVWL